MSITHVSWSTVGHLPLFADEATRRDALHVLGAHFAGRLVAFAFVDDHVHLVLLGAVEALRAQVRNLGFALTPLLAAPLALPHFAPVSDDAHLRSVLRYALEQPVHHGVGEHPALTTGSCWPEIVGARAVPGLALALDTVFPRAATRPELAPVVGLTTEVIDPMSPLAIRRLGAWRLMLAAASAAGVATLDGQAAPRAAARRAVAVLGAEAGIDVGELAFALNVTADAVRRLRARESDPALVRATRVRLALEQAVATASRTAAIERLADGIAGRKVGLGRSRIAART